MLLTPDRYEADISPAFVDSLRQRNLTIRMGSYFPAWFVYGWQRRAGDSLRRDSISGEWWNTLNRYIVRTDSLDPGTANMDTAALWLDDMVINVLNPDCRHAMVDIYQRHLGKRVDFLMLDFLTIPLPDMKVWQGPRYQRQEHGDLDFDGNGTNLYHDPAEQAALRQAFISLLTELHAAMPNMLLLPNGNLALWDTTVARLTDGVYLEKFPECLAGWQFDFVRAVSADNPIGLPALTAPRYRNGRGLVWLEDSYDYGLFGYLAAMYDGVVENKRANREHTPALPLVLNMGAPLGPAVGNVREFKKGTLTVTVGASWISHTFQPRGEQ